MVLPSATVAGVAAVPPDGCALTHNDAESPSAPPSAMALAPHLIKPSFDERSSNAIPIATAELTSREGVRDQGTRVGIRASGPEARIALFSNSNQIQWSQQLARMP